MAADYKNLFIQYIDKIAFVGFLLLFGWQSSKFITTSTPPSDPVPPLVNESFPEDPALPKERVVLKNFTDPLQPDATHDITSDPEKIEPGRDEKQCPRCGWITPRDLRSCPRCKYSWSGLAPPPENDTNTSGPEKVKDVPLATLDIAFRPVNILFMGLMVPPGKVLRNPPQPGDCILQINWAGNTRTSMVPLGGFFQDYELYPLERGVETYKPPGISLTVKRDTYFLTIKKKGEQPIRVAKKQTITEDLPVATIQAEGNWQVRQGGNPVPGQSGTTFDVYRGDTIKEIGGQNREYEVLEVSQTQVRIKDSQGKEYVLPFKSR